MLRCSQMCNQTLKHLFLNLQLFKIIQIWSSLINKSMKKMQNNLKLIKKIEFK